MAAAETARLIASLELKDNMSKGLSSAERSLGKLESRAFRVGQTIGKGINTAASNIARLGFLAGGIAVVGLTKSVQAASNLEQAIGAVDSVYGKSAKTIEAWGNSAAEAAGLSKREVNEMAAVTGAQLQGMGFETEEAAKQAVILQKRAADLAATFGGPTSDAMQAISSLMRGERDPIERYGVSIKSVDVAARIQAKGLDTSTAAAKKNAEAVAGMELLMEQTAKTQGQFAREADGLAGSQARLKANLENTGAIIGTVLLPQLAKLVGKFNDFLVAKQPEIAKFAEGLPAIFDKVLAAVERIPWEGIGTSLQIAGTGAKALLDAFLGAPAWLQTAVLTGWGLNKLTGGALTDIGKIGIQAAFEQFAGKGSTPANPLFVADVSGGLGGKIGGAAATAGAVGTGTALAAIAAAGIVSYLATAGFADKNTAMANKGLNSAEIAALKYYESDTATQQAALKHLGSMPSKADYDSALAKLGRTLQSPDERPGRTTTGGVTRPTVVDSPRTAPANLADLEAILARGRAAGFKPTFAAAQATNQKNLERLAESQITKMNEVKTAVLAGDTRSELAGIRSAVDTAGAKQPIVNVTTNVTVTAANVKKSITIQRRAGPSGGSRNQSGPLEFDP